MRPRALSKGADGQVSAAALIVLLNRDRNSCGSSKLSEYGVSVGQGVQLAEHELDIKLLMWDLERGVRARAFGATRTVVRVEFLDQPAAKKFWWFVNEAGRAELCVKDPWLEPDLYLASTLRDMIGVRRGDISLSQALASERLEVIGPRKLRKALSAWLTLSPLTKIRPRHS